MSENNFYSTINPFSPVTDTRKLNSVHGSRANRKSRRASRVATFAVGVGVGTAFALSNAAVSAADSASADRADADTTASSGASSGASRSGASSVRHRSAVAPAAAASSWASSWARRFGSSPTTSVPTASVPTTSAPTTSAPTPPAPTAPAPTAPAPVTTSPQTAGVSATATPPYFAAADWLWKPIPANPVLASNSATWSGLLGAAGTKHIADLVDFGVTMIPASSVTPTTPRYSVKLTQKWGPNPFGSNTIPLPRGTKIPPGSDGHIAVLDPASGKAYGIWQAKYNATTDSWSGSWGGVTALNGNGVDTAGSATGAGIARYAGVITAADMGTAISANTGINHALVFSTDIAASSFVGPAAKSDGVNLARVVTPIPEGYRIQLDPAINVDAIPGITLAERVIAKTLQTYGAYVIDNGGARMAFLFEMIPGSTSSKPGAAWSSAGLQWDYYDMSKIPWSKLRVLAP